VQIDVAGPLGVYLSMVETGKRMPSEQMLHMLAGIFGKIRAGSSTKHRVEVAPAQRERGGLEAMPLKPPFCSPTNCCRMRCRKLLSQTGTPVGNLRNADSRLAGNASQQFPRHRAGRRGMRRPRDAPDPRCADGDLQAARLQVNWFDERRGRPAGGRRVDQVPIEAPGTVLVNRRLRSRKGA